jgi:hypothetical protein
MSDISQLLLFGEVLPDGTGGFVVKPRKPLPEVTTKEAARILGVSRAQMWYLRNHHPRAMQILRFRFSSERRGRVLWDVDSLHQFRQMTRELEA